jgi:hypothetical protein
MVLTYEPNELPSCLPRETDRIIGFPSSGVKQYRNEICQLAKALVS